MRQDLWCWRCGTPLADIPLPLSRRAECTRCHAELHVCRMCEDYEPRLTGHCREDQAEEVRDAEQANFCDYFRPSVNAFRPQDDAATRTALAELEALFGEQGAEGAGRPTPDAALESLQELFGAAPGDRGEGKT